VDAVRWYINVGKTDVNKPDKNGSTPLFYTIQKNHVVLVKDLISAGAGRCLRPVYMTHLPGIK
jgi:ankyrin repeat protein